MAADVKLLDFFRPSVDAFDAAGMQSGQEDADYILLTLDRYSNGRAVVNHKLFFADYTGLEAEWDAGVATTVFAASVTSEVLLVTWPTEQLSSAQKALASTNYTE